MDDFLFSPGGLTVGKEDPPRVVARVDYSSIGRRVYRWSIGRRVYRWSIQLRRGMLMADMPTRAKSPSRLVRDKALQRFKTTQQTTSPVVQKYPPTMVSLFCQASGANKNRVYRWLADPDRYPLDWAELVKIAEELGAKLRVMFSDLD